MRYLILFALLAISLPAFAGTIEEDKSAGRIIAYYGIGHEDSPATSLTLSQFKAHLKELNTGEYNVIALPDMLNAYEKKAPLPQNSIILTFDGSEKSVLTHAAPLLKKLKYPFTVFISPERVRDNNPRHLNRKDIKRLQKMPLVTFGIHPEGYDNKKVNDLTQIRKNLNNAVAFYRELFKEQPKYLAFSNGFYSDVQLNNIAPYNFKALLGQQSGVTYENKKGSILPRFVMTENHAHQDRFRMVANALPLPANDITPNYSIINKNDPALGFTISSNLNLEKLSCYASSQPKPSIEKINNRVEIRLKSKIIDPRFRVNCTIPEKNEETDEIRWRWLGYLLNSED